MASPENSSRSLADLESRKQFPTSLGDFICLAQDKAVEAVVLKRALERAQIEYEEARGAFLALGGGERSLKARTARVDYYELVALYDAAKKTAFLFREEATQLDEDRRRKIHKAHSYRRSRRANTSKPDEMIERSSRIREFSRGKLGKE